MSLATLLDTVKARIVAFDFDLPDGEALPVIRRRYLPDEKLESLAAMHVDISPGTAEYDFADRSELEGQFVVQIGFRQAVPPDVSPAEESGNAWLDGRLMIIRNVLANLAGNAHDAEDDEVGYALNTVKNDPMYDVDVLRKHGVFLSIVELTYSQIQ